MSQQKTIIHVRSRPGAKKGAVHVVVSKKVSPKAVVRNRIKRLLRAAAHRLSIPREQKDVFIHCVQWQPKTTLSTLEELIQKQPLD